MKEEDSLRFQHDSQMEQQDASSDAQARLYAPQLREQLAEAQAAIIAQTDPSKALGTILNSFKGIIVEDGKEVQYGEPLMNELGNSKIASMLTPFISDPIRFGNISEKEVRKLSLKIINDITRDIGLNWREYGIKNPSHKDLIVDSLLALIFITLTRSEDQGEKRFFQKVVLESLGGGTKKPSKKESTWQKYFKL